MKKLVSCLLCLVLFLCFTGCNEDVYQEAKNQMDSGEYATAISKFESLAAENYKDSAKLLKEAKYRYVKKNFDKSDPNTVSYLNELKNEGYKESKKLYKELYKWQVNIAVNLTQYSGVHYENVYVSDQILPLYFFNFRTFGGPPEGSFKGRYEITFSNGTKISDSFTGSDNSFYYSITLYAQDNPGGRTVFSVYGEDGKALGSKVSYIY